MCSCGQWEVPELEALKFHFLELLFGESFE